ncbi:hypothetical protein ACKI2N_020390 [Cupriavidus sp. 30B13]|uniref:hypothetical protein n=1 Tax=Cupriavidus sp. 30B13 TaxID=3384241 RepID=UPI003B91EBF7
MIPTVTRNLLATLVVSAASLGAGMAHAAPATARATAGAGYVDRPATAGRFLTASLAASERRADPYTDGARNGPRDPYTDGARIGPRDPYTDGARGSGVVSRFVETGMDRSGVSADPGQNQDA